MNRTLTYHITPSEEGLSIREYLQQCGYSRHILTLLRQTMGLIQLHAEGVPNSQPNAGSPDNAPALRSDLALHSALTLRHGLAVRTTALLHSGDVLTVFIPEEHASELIVPVPLAFDSVYEDEDILVVNKPADMPVHPSLNNYTNTLANGVAAYYQTQDSPFVFRCINRLDRNTSGLLIIGKNVLSSAILSRSMKQREIHREYLAIAKGQITEAGTISAPIARKDASMIERCVNFETGESAITHFHPVHYNEALDLTLLSLRLETGRTHQIRVHMRYIGHPLIGDYLYHPDFTYINRQALHSHRLEFIHPIKKEPMQLQAPLPPDMKFILE